MYVLVCVYVYIFLTDLNILPVFVGKTLLVYTQAYLACDYSQQSDFVTYTQKKGC